jgi:NAD(P)-dependent dehydrogenase (short-subunit alcohol dehydrogenase family)
MGRLQGKVAIVTGGSLGIGRACVERFAEEGAHVAIFDVLSEPGEKLTEELEQRGFTVAFWQVDVSREPIVKAAIGEVVARFGRLDILINNAGVSGAAKPTDEVSEEEWDFVQAVNVKGVFLATKHCVPYLRSAGGGSIVNLSSIAGLVGIGGVAPYHASKGAVRLMTKNDAITYAPEGIRVNSIHPAYIWTPMVENHLKRTSDDLEAAKAAAASVHPVGRMGEPDDIAWAAEYLSSDEARFVTGAELVVDGGYTAR